MSTQRSINSRSLQARDRLSYEQKVINYGRVGGHSGLSRMKSCKEILAKDIQTDGRGNIVKMPPLIGRPCFAIPTGYLRERCAPPILANGRYRPSSKCNQCKVRTGCHKVVVERSKYVDSLTGSLLPPLREWSDAGGVALYGFDKALEKVGLNAWRKIAYAFQTVTFTNSNDVVVQKFWDGEEERFEKLRKSAAVKRLRRDWSEGRSLAGLTNGLHQGRNERLAILLLTLTVGPKPKYLARVFQDAAERIASAWWGREFAKLTGGKGNANYIAGILIAENMNLGVCKSSLRSTVKQDLNRIKKLEAVANYNGGAAIWPKFLHPDLIV